MAIERHLANWHNVWRFNRGAGLSTFKTYGSRTSEDRLVELHAILHETKADMLALEHEYEFVGTVAPTQVKGSRCELVRTDATICPSCGHALSEAWVHRS